MIRVLIFWIGAFIIFFFFSCSGSTNKKAVAVFLDSVHNDTSGQIEEDSFPGFQNIFYPDSSADTNLVIREGNVSIYSIMSQECRFTYDWVVRLQGNNIRNSRLWEDNMQDLVFGYDSIFIREIEINGRGNKELIIAYPLEGHHLYAGDFFGLGDMDEGGWSLSNTYLEIWDIDKMRVLFRCIPYDETWTKEDRHDKNHYSFYRYEFNITPDHQIILHNLVKKVKNKIVPDRSGKADVSMGTYQFRNDTFIFVKKGQ